MNIGDKVYCVKNYTHTYPPRFYKKGEYYEIQHIVEFDRLNYHTHKVIIDNILFSLLKNTNLGYNINFYDYFITQKEYRKLKLQKLSK